jgi:peptidoglycan hydrolase-like protein with peptidoglycan-binding domain
MIEQNTPRVAIQNLQRYLRQLALYDNSIPSLAIDGIYGAETRAAVIAFQRAAGLPETGIVDYTTWLQLFDAYMESVLRYEEPQCFSPFPRFPIGYSVGIGNREFLVEIIQYMLNELSVWFDDLPRNNQGGVFDEDTENGVRLFQGVHLLPTTGRVDRATWEAMVHSYQRMLKENA